jgi:hypothetical protein
MDASFRVVSGAQFNDLDPIDQDIPQEPILYSTGVDVYFYIYNITYSIFLWGSNLYLAYFYNSYFYFIGGIFLYLEFYIEK